MSARFRSHHTLKSRESSCGLWHLGLVPIGPRFRVEFFFPLSHGGPPEGPPRAPGTSPRGGHPGGVRVRGGPRTKNGEKKVPRTKWYRTASAQRRAHWLIAAVQCMVAPPQDSHMQLHKNGFLTEKSTLDISVAQCCLRSPLGQIVESIARTTVFEGPIKMRSTHAILLL